MKSTINDFDYKNSLKLSSAQNIMLFPNGVFLIHNNSTIPLSLKIISEKKLQPNIPYNPSVLVSQLPNQQASTKPESNYSTNEPMEIKQFDSTILTEDPLSQSENDQTRIKSDSNILNDEKVEQSSENYSDTEQEQITTTLFFFKKTQSIYEHLLMERLCKASYILAKNNLVKTVQIKRVLKRIIKIEQKISFPELYNRTEEIYTDFINLDNNMIKNKTHYVVNNGLFSEFTNDIIEVVNKKSFYSLNLHYFLMRIWKKIAIIYGIELDPMVSFFNLILNHRKNNHVNDQINKPDIQLDNNRVNVIISNPTEKRIYYMHSAYSLTYDHTLFLNIAKDDSKILIPGYSSNQIINKTNSIIELNHHIIKTLLPNENFFLYNFYMDDKEIKVKQAPPSYYY